MRPDLQFLKGHGRKILTKVAQIFDDCMDYYIF